MRVAVYLLAFGNLVLFVIAGGLAIPAPSGDAAGELSPGRIAIVSRGVPPPVPVAVSAVSSSPASSSAGRAGCLLWSRLTQAEGDRLAALAATEGLELTREAVVPAAHWWVHIPPSGGRAGAEKKAAELRKLGVRGFAIDDGTTEAMRFAISFGRFDTEVEAAKQLDALRQKGVRSAKVLAETAGEVVERVQVKGAANQLAALRRALVDGPAPESCAEPGPEHVAPATAEAGGGAALSREVTVPAPQPARP